MEMVGSDVLLQIVDVDRQPVHQGPLLVHFLLLDDCWGMHSWGDLVLSSWKNVGDIEMVDDEMIECM